MTKASVEELWESWMAAGPNTPEQRVRYAAFQRRRLASLKELGDDKEATRAADLSTLTIREALRRFAMLVPPRSSPLWRLRDEPSATTIALRDVLARRKSASKSGSDHE